MKKLLLFLTLSLTCDGLLGAFDSTSHQKPKVDILRKSINDPKNDQKKDGLIAGIVKGLGWGYAITWGSLIAHELGHALVATAFGCRVKEISVGVPIEIIGPFVLPKTDSSILSLFDTFYIRSMMPSAGFCKLEEDDFCALSPLKRFCVAAAGPAAGMTTSLFLAYKIRKRNKDKKKESMVENGMVAAVAGGNFLDQLINYAPLFPLDGWYMQQAWQEMKQQ